MQIFSGLACVRHREQGLRLLAGAGRVNLDVETGIRGSSNTKAPGRVIHFESEILVELLFCVQLGDRQHKAKQAGGDTVLVHMQPLIQSVARTRHVLRKLGGPAFGIPER